MLIVTDLGRSIRAMRRMKLKRGTTLRALLGGLVLGLLTTAVALAATGDIGTFAGSGAVGFGAGGFTGDGGGA